MKRLTRIALLLLAALAIFAAGFLVAGGGEKLKKVAGPSGPRIDRVELTGDDLARVLDFQTLKYRLSVPPGKYRVRVWLDEWARGQTGLTSHGLTELSDWRGGEEILLLHVPCVPEQPITVALGGTLSRAAAPPALAKRPAGVQKVGREPIEIGKDVPLMALGCGSGFLASGFDQPPKRSDEAEQKFVLKLRVDTETE